MSQVQARQSVVEFCKQVAQAIQTGSGVLCGKLMSLRLKQETAFGALIAQTDAVVTQIVTAVPSNLLSTTGYDEAIANHILAYVAIAQGNLQLAFDNQVNAVDAFLKPFAKDKGNWGLDPLRVLVVELRLLARRVDDEFNKEGEPAARNIAMGKIRDCFSTVRSDQSTGTLSKRWGMLMLINQLMCISFQVTNFALTKPLIRSMDQQQNEMFKEDAYISDRVTYSYYLGRLKMFDGDYDAADTELSFAFKHCHQDSIKNKRLILIYLIPLKLMHGKIPSRSMLMQYDLPEFANVAQAVREGNLSKLANALTEHQVFFIQWGVFLILERLRIVCYKNLFKKVHAILGTTQIKLAAFVTALKATQAEDVDLDEVECIVANLIFQKQIKGYISHPLQTLVVSKVDAFPATTGPSS